MARLSCDPGNDFQRQAFVCSGWLAVPPLAAGSWQLAAGSRRPVGGEAVGDLPVCQLSATSSQLSDPKSEHRIAPVPILAQATLSISPPCVSLALAIASGRETSIPCSSISARHKTLTTQPSVPSDGAAAQTNQTLELCYSPAGILPVLVLVVVHIRCFGSAIRLGCWPTWLPCPTRAA